MADRSSPHLDLEIVAAWCGGTATTSRCPLDSASPTAVLRHQSGGVVISTRPVSADNWFTALAVDVGRLARTNGAAVAALARLTATGP